MIMCDISDLKKIQRSLPLIDGVAAVFWIRAGSGVLVGLCSCISVLFGITQPFAEIFVINADYVL